MAQLFHLEEFTANAPRSASVPSGEQNDSQRMETYEQGYQAGYDDAAKSFSDDQTRISAEFSLNLQDLGFTFHEARSHVLNSLEPLLLAIVDKLLPELVAHTIGRRILEEITPLAELAADTPIQVVVGPSCRPAIETLLNAATTCPFELVEEPSLGPGQIYLRSGKLEKNIDVQSVIMAITDAMSALESENQEVFAHA